MDHFLVLHMITLKSYHVQSALNEVLNTKQYIASNVVRQCFQQFRGLEICSMYVVMLAAECLLARFIQWITQETFLH